MDCGATLLRGCVFAPGPRTFSSIEHLFLKKINRLKKYMCEFVYISIQIFGGKFFDALY